MSTELHIPVIDGRTRTEYYLYSETHRRRSEAAKKRAARYWADPKNRERVRPEARAVDAFTLDGHYVGTWPSAYRAAAALFPDGDARINGTNIAHVCKGRRGKTKGYRFRYALPDKSDIGPLSTEPRRRRGGYKRPDTVERFNRPCAIHNGDGDLIRFDSLNDLADAIHGERTGIWLARKQGRPYKGWHIVMLDGKGGRP